MTETSRQAEFTPHDRLQLSELKAWLSDKEYPHVASLERAIAVCDAAALPSTTPGEAVKSCRWPQKQTTPSNCFAACVASILGVPVAEVPGVDGAAWCWDAFQSWTKRHGLQAIEVRWPDGEGVLYPSHGAPCVLSGKSPRGDKLHAVVAVTAGVQGFTVVHDPHPEASDEPFLGEPTHATFFVPLEAALSRGAGKGWPKECNRPTEPGWYWFYPWDHRGRVLLYELSDATGGLCVWTPDCVPCGKLSEAMDGYWQPASVPAPPSPLAQEAG